MNDAVLIERLVLFGLTRQEANLYLCLLLNGGLTGYEAAKKTGISRSNVYNGLSGLVDKGAAYLIEGSVVKYTAVSIEDFCSHKISALSREKDFLIESLPKKDSFPEGYITIAGYENILDRMITMINSTEKRLYLSAENTVIQLLADEINRIILQDKKVVLLTEGDCGIRETNLVHVYQTGKRKNQVRLIIDSRYVLTGIITGGNQDTCLYCGQPDFVNVFKEALSNEIKLIELKK